MANFTITQLEQALMEARRKGDEEAVALIQQEIQRVKTVPQNTEKAHLVGRAREVGMDPRDLFVEPHTQGEKFLADLDYGLENTALNLGQFAANANPMIDARGINQYITDREAEYQAGLGRENTGGRLAASMITEAPMAVARGAATPFMAGAREGGLSGLVNEPVPGVENATDYFKGKLADIGIGAAFGGAFEGAPTAITGAVEGGANAGRNAYRWLEDPSRSPSGSPLGGAPEERAAALETMGATGIPFTPGQRSQNPSLLQGEQLARESIWTRARVAESDAIREREFQRYVDDFVESLGGASDPRTVGAKIQSWGREQAEQMAARRQEMARRDYARVVEIGSPVLAQNYASFLENLIRRADGVTGAGDSDVAKAARTARAQLERLEANGWVITPQEVVDLTMSGRANSGTPFGVMDAQMGDYLRAQAREAIEADVLAQNPQMGEALSIAKANYAINSDAIRAFEVEITGRVIGKEFASDLDGMMEGTVSPEKVFRQMLRADPSQIEFAMERLTRANPDLANEFRATVLRDALESSRLTSPTGGLSNDIDPGAFLRHLGLGGEKGRADALRRLYVLFPDQPEFITNVHKAAQILADARTANRSGTDIRQEARGALGAAGDLITNAVTGAITALARGAFKLGGGAGSLNYVARTMDPRHALWNSNRPPRQFPAGRQVIEWQGGIPTPFRSQARGITEDELTGENRR